MPLTMQPIQHEIPRVIHCSLYDWQGSVYFIDEGSCGVEFTLNHHKILQLKNAYENQWVKNHLPKICFLAPVIYSKNHFTSKNRLVFIYKVTTLIWIYMYFFFCFDLVKMYYTDRLFTVQTISLLNQYLVVAFLCLYEMIKAPYTTETVLNFPYI